MSKSRKDPRQGNAGNLGDWLKNPRNREKMYRHDREAAVELAAIRKEERQRNETAGTIDTIFGTIPVTFHDFTKKGGLE